MPDPLRSENAEVKSPLATEGIDQLLAGLPAEQALPPAENPRLNQAAETIGAALGTTVGKVRNGLAVVYDRQREMTREVSDRVSQQTEKVSAAVTEKAEQLGDMAEEKVSEFADVAQQRFDEVSRVARRRLTELRRQAATLQHDRPIELILSFAGAAFVTGILLRVWRSNND